MPVIFISYRRSDSQDVTGRIYDRLVAKFEKKQVFKDVDNIPLGVSFPTHLKQQLARANVALVIIGPNWVSATDKQGKRRLDDPNDFVRVEVETALRNNMPVIPVLVSNAPMPSADELPPSMQALAARNGMAVRPDPDFNNDIVRLFSGLNKLANLPDAEAAFVAPLATPVVAARPPKKQRSGKRILAYGLIAALLPVCALAILAGSALIPRSDVVKKAIGDKIPLVKGDKPAEIKMNPPADLKAPPAKQITNGIGMKLTYIAPGSFWMGSPKWVFKGTGVPGTSETGEPKKKKSETGEPKKKKLGQPNSNEFQHEVELTKGFYMGVYAVTQDEYQTVMGENPSWFTPLGGGKGAVAGLDTRNFPVERVSWTNATEFCRKLSRTEGKAYRLPTEAEWEYACRAGTTTAFHFGEELYTDQANYNAKLPREVGARPTKAGSFPANAWGLHDMHGNVWQWCEVWYDGDYYRNSPRVNPINETMGQFHVIRGGAWNNTAWSCNSGSRLKAAEAGSEYVGFRVVLPGP